MPLSLKELASSAGARIVVHAQRAASLRIARVFASDKISELLHHGGPDTLLLTTLANPHLLRAASLVGAPALCLTGGGDIPPSLRAGAEAHGIVLLHTLDNLAQAMARFQDGRRTD